MYALVNESIKINLEAAELFGYDTNLNVYHMFLLVNLPRKKTSSLVHKGQS